MTKEGLKMSTLLLLELPAQTHQQAAAQTAPPPSQHIPPDKISQTNKTLQRQTTNTIIDRNLSCRQQRRPILDSAATSLQEKIDPR
jgi:hypothetical protein